MLVKDRTVKILYLVGWAIITIGMMIKSTSDGPLAYQIFMWLGIVINLVMLYSIVKDYVNAEEA